MRCKVKRILILSILIFAILVGWCGSTRVFADDDGYIGGDSNYGSGGGGSGSGTGSCKPGSDSGGDCMGISWIYYKATGNAGASGAAIIFSPRLNSYTKNNVIPAECSLSGRGFWALGIGGYGKLYKYIIDKNGNKVPAFRDVAASSHYVYKNKYYDAANQYSTAKAKYGLQGLYPWAYKGDMSATWTSRKYVTFANSKLSHNLIKKISDKYVTIYQAKQYGVIDDSNGKFISAYSKKFTKATADNIDSLTPVVWREFNKAYKYKNGSYYDGTNFPNSLFAFCYWDGMETKFTLSGDAIDEEGGPLDWPSSVPDTMKVDENETAYLEAPETITNDDGDVMTFLHWQNTSDPDDTTIVTTKCPRSSNPQYACISKTNPRYLEVNKLTTNRKYYAVYSVTKYSLSASAEDMEGNELRWPESVSNVAIGRQYDSVSLRYPTAADDSLYSNYTFNHWENENGTTVKTACPRPDGVHKNLCLESNGRIGIRSIEKSRMAIAVYQGVPMTLKLEAVDESGSYLGNLSGEDAFLRIADVTFNGHYNAEAHVTRDNSNENYTFLGYKIASSRAATTQTPDYFTTPRDEDDDLQTQWVADDGSYHVRHLKANATVYAVYKRKEFTITICAKDQNGNNLTWTAPPNKSTTKFYNKSIEINPPSIAGHSFTAWKNSAGNEVTQNCERSDGQTWLACKNGNTLRISTLRNNAEYCAYYQIQPRYLTIKAYQLKSDGTTVYLGDKSGVYQVTDVVAQVNYGSNIAATRRAPDAYTFNGFRRNLTDTSYFTSTDTNSSPYVSGSASPKETYNVKGITTNTTIYAIYTIKTKTLTGVSVDGNGNTLSGVSGLANKTHTVEYWSTATITRGTATGYSYYGWATSIDNARNKTFVTTTTNTSAAFVSGDATPKEKYNVLHLTDNVTVYARYDRNEFAGKLTAYKGDSTSGTTNNSTNWTEESTTANLKIDCPNAGCKATFDLRLKTILGTGTTAFSVQRKKNSGSYATVTTSPASPTAPSSATNGTAINKSTGNYVEDLLPGETVCYKLIFRPYGKKSDGTDRANDTTATLESCVNAEVSLFEGKSSMTGAESATTDWVKTSKTETKFIENCTNGCSVSFNHRMKRTQGVGSMDYKITRTSNLTESGRKIDSNSNVKTGTFSPSGTNPVEAEVSANGPFTLYPGVVVCETLTFKPSNSAVGTVSNVASKICASALGKAQPDDPIETPDPTDPNCPTCPDTDPNGNDPSSALVDIEVKNNTVNKYNTYRRVVYAKPGDSLTFRASYNPILQYTYYLKPQQLRVGGGNIYPRDDGGNVLVNSTSTLATLFDRIQSDKTTPEPGWNNDIYVRSSNFYSNSFSSPYDYTDGDPTRHTETNDHEVLKGEGGRAISEYAYVNYSGNDTVKTTPRQVTFTANGNNNLGNVTIGQKYNTAYARVPYNYTTNIRITTPTDDPVDSGEDMSINYEVDVLPKDNPVTNNPGDPPYATKTIYSQIKVIVYIANDPKPGTASWTGDKNADLCAYYGTTKDKAGDTWDCSHYVATNRTLNSSGKLEGVTETSLPTATFSIPDRDAGTKVCAAAAIYPANSGDDRNYNNSNGSGSWRISDSKCFTIAKKPNLQVLGGGVYSAKNIVTSVAVKRNLYGIYPVTLTSRDNTTIFGSWGEQQIVSVGNITGFASGASTGYFGTTSTNPPASGRTPVSGLGGSKEGNNVDFCVRSPLTMANSTSSTPCVNRSATGGMTASSTETIPTDKEKLIARFTEGANPETITYDKIDGDHTIGATVTNRGLTHVIHATGNITINGNLTYQEGYTILADVPKLIIYAEGNITISCSVSRIDAVLIAGKTNSDNGVVNTCPTDLTNQAEIDRQINSRQLKINGTVIANRLIANRTYGAAKGVNSVVPAEIIDYDSTLFLWGMQESKGSNTGRLSTTYQHEIAPRY